MSVVDGDGDAVESAQRWLRAAEAHRRAALMADARQDHAAAARHHRASAREYAEAAQALETAATRD